MVKNVLYNVLVPIRSFVCELYSALPPEPQLLILRLYESTLETYRDENKKVSKIGGN